LDTDITKEWPAVLMTFAKTLNTDLKLTKLIFQNIKANNEKNRCKLQKIVLM